LDAVPRGAPHGPAAQTTTRGGWGTRSTPAQGGRSRWSRGGASGGKTASFSHSDRPDTRRRAIVMLGRMWSTAPVAGCWPASRPPPVPRCNASIGPAQGSGTNDIPNREHPTRESISIEGVFARAGEGRRPRQPHRTRARHVLARLIAVHAPVRHGPGCLRVLNGTVSARGSSIGGVV
jgi:hypothetical protein